ncbi:MAG: glycosyl hydrolase, partial [Saprospiraceae bacterium]|nr:glycosyl hydrolase [Saprospiraceae bacterium]
MNRSAALVYIIILIFPFINHVDGQSSMAFDSAFYSGVKWRLVGPFRGGRSATVTGVNNNPNLYYMGTAGGGVWKTNDGGNTWSCISDGFFGGSIGAVAVAPSDPNVIYVGEGEETVRGDVSSGWGCWKSQDAGNTWSKIGLSGTEHISRIRVHPENPDIVFVAAMGNLWKPNEERGIYKSTDGGKNWKKVLYISDHTAASDLILDPNNPRIIYAGMWDIKRNGYRMDSGGPGSGLWKSTDGGETWKEITESSGLPKDTWGIVGITVSPVNSNRLWVIIESLDGGVFRSDDGGSTWSKTNEDRALRQRAWYYSRIYADTQNEDMVYVMNVSYHRSKDGGKTFESFNAPHGDHHDLWIDPNNNQRMIIADDGGGQVSYDGGENWTTYHNQPTAQFYRVTTDNHFPYHILGAQQDNSTVRILHRTDGNAITESDWASSAGGESAHLAADPENPEIVYGGTYKGYMLRMDHSTGQVRSTNVWPYNPAGSGVEVMKYRFNWNFPILFSPHDPKKLYAGSNHLHVTTNEGQSWSVISPDLTRNDPETLKSSGGPITQDNTGVEFYGT